MAEEEGKESNRLRIEDDTSDKEVDTTENTATDSTKLVTGEASSSPTDGSRPFTEEEAKQREAWNKELMEVEEDIKTLKETLVSKQRHAAELRKALGYNLIADVREKVRNLQESEMMMRTNQAFKSAGERTSTAFTNIGKRFGDVRSRLGESIGSSFSNVKARVNGSRYSSGSRGLGGSGSPAVSREQSVSAPLEEDISLYDDLDDNYFE